MVKVVVINGRPGCGKTTFEQICQQLCKTNLTTGFRKERIVQVAITSTVDFVKEIALNVDGMARKLLKIADS